MCVINRDEGHETGYECSCLVRTLHSMCKHTIRLAHDRNELDLHPHLCFRSLGRQEKGEFQKTKDEGMIRILNFNFFYELFVSLCL